MSIRVRERDGVERTCVFCRDALGTDDSRTACSVCAVELHAECQAELRRCPTQGCAGTFGGGAVPPCVSCGEAMSASVDRYTCTACGVGVHSACRSGLPGCPSCGGRTLRLRAGVTADDWALPGAAPPPPVTRPAPAAPPSPVTQRAPERGHATAKSMALQAFVTVAALWWILGFMFAGALDTSRAHPRFNLVSALKWGPLAGTLVAAAIGPYVYLVNWIGVQRPPTPGAKLVNTGLAFPLGCAAMLLSLKGDVAGAVAMVVVYLVALIPVLHYFGFDLPKSRRY